MRLLHLHEPKTKRNYAVPVGPSNILYVVEDDAKKAVFIFAVPETSIQLPGSIKDKEGEPVEDANDGYPKGGAFWLRVAESYREVVNKLEESA